MLTELLKSPWPLGDGFLRHVKPRGFLREPSEPDRSGVLAGDGMVRKSFDCGWGGAVSEGVRRSQSRPWSGRVAGAGQTTVPDDTSGHLVLAMPITAAVAVGAMIAGGVRIVVARHANPAAGHD